MRPIRDVLRLKAGGASEREIARSLSLARSKVGRALAAAKAAGLAWPAAGALSEAALAVALGRRAGPAANLGARRKAEPDWAAIPNRH